jgi:hypothetical protein
MDETYFPSIPTMFDPEDVYKYWDLGNYVVFQKVVT